MKVFFLIGLLVLSVAIVGCEEAYTADTPTEQDNQPATETQTESTGAESEFVDESDDVTIGEMV